MGIITPEGSQYADLGGATLRDGKIFAANRDTCVEDRYPVAYNLGCGKKDWPGWIGVDLVGTGAAVEVDLRDLSPIADESADAVAAIHVLEHFYLWETEALIREWRRILKPGGKMILELPSMNSVFRYIAQCVVTGAPMEAFMSVMALYGNPAHKDPAMCHKWGWFEEDVIGLLERAGMREVRRVPARYHFPFRDMRVEAIR